MNRKQRRKELIRMRNKQERLYRKLVIEHNKEILKKRGIIGVYDKMGNLIEK